MLESSHHDELQKLVKSIEVTLVGDSLDSAKGRKALSGDIQKLIEEVTKEFKRVQLVRDELACKSEELRAKERELESRAKTLVLEEQWVRAREASVKEKEELVEEHTKELKVREQELEAAEEDRGEVHTVPVHQQEQQHSRAPPQAETTSVSQEPIRDSAPAGDDGDIAQINEISKSWILWCLGDQKDDEKGSNETTNTTDSTSTIDTTANTTTVTDKEAPTKVQEGAIENTTEPVGEEEQTTPPRLPHARKHKHHHHHKHTHSSDCTSSHEHKHHSPSHNKRPDSADSPRRHKNSSTSSSEKPLRTSDDTRPKEEQPAKPDFESYDDQFADLPRTEDLDLFSRAHVINSSKEPQPSGDDMDFFFGDEPTTSAAPAQPATPAPVRSSKPPANSELSLDFTNAFVQLRDYTENKIMEIDSVKATAAENRKQLNLLSNPRFARAMFEILNAKSQQITTAFRRKQINDSEYDKLTTTLNATRREIAEITHQNTKKTVSLTIHRRPFIDWAFMTKEVESFNEVYNTDDYLKLCILETIEAHVNDLRTQLISAIIARSPCLAQWIATAWAGMGAVKQMTFTYLMQQTAFLEDVLHQLDLLTDGLSTRERPIIFVTEWCVCLQLLESRVHSHSEVGRGSPILHW